MRRAANQRAFAVRACLPDTGRPDAGRPDTGQRRPANLIVDAEPRRSTRPPRRAGVSSVVPMVRTVSPSWLTGTAAKTMCIMIALRSPRITLPHQQLLKRGNSPAFPGSSSHIRR